MGGTGGNVSKLTLGTHCHAVRERTFTLLGEWAEDITSEGMLLRTDREVELGETVLVSFRVPPMGTWLDAEARVVRVHEPDGAPRCVELAFDEIEDIWRTVICEIVLDRMLESFAAAS
jgi:hypothetical protein